MKHRGQVIEKAVRRNGIKISELANRLGNSRRHVYNIFSNPHVPIDTIVQIGNIIHYDFARELSDLQELKRNSNHFADNQQNSSANETETLKKDIENWKSKYYVLLEKYNDILNLSLNNLQNLN